MKSHGVSKVLSLVFSFLILFPTRVYANYVFKIPNNKNATIELIENTDQIDKKASKEILIDAFITEYKQYLKPNEIDAKLNCWFKIDGENSVEEYYAQYFESELGNFNQGKLYWIVSKIEGKLVGWATYERQKNAADYSPYMNLLIVHPDFQKMGIGRELVFSVNKLGLFPKVKVINVLLRKKNLGGKAFYSKLGFQHDPSYQGEVNYVDNALLEGWTFNNSPRK